MFIDWEARFGYPATGGKIFARIENAGSCPMCQLPVDNFPPPFENVFYKTLPGMVFQGMLNNKF